MTISVSLGYILLAEHTAVWSQWFWSAIQQLSVVMS